MNLRTAYERFVRMTKVCAEETRANDLRAIAQFEQLIPEVTDLPYQEIGNAVFARFRKIWMDRGGNPATGNRHMSKVKAMLRYIAELGELDRIPVFRRIPEDPPDPRAASDDEIRLMLKAAELTEWPTIVCSGCYWKAIILTGVNLGLRRQDILAAKWSDYDATEQELTIRTGKNKRTLCLPVVVETVLAWERIRIDGRSEIFFSTRSNRQFYREWHRIQREAGIADHYGIHDLRRTCANRIAAIAGENAACEALGHSTPNVTRKHYLTSKTKGKHLRGAIEQASFGFSDSALDSQVATLTSQFRRLSRADRETVLTMVSRLV